MIAFRGGRYKNLLLGLVVVPFFTSYLVRTLAWKTILQDQGPFVGFLRDIHVVSENGRLLSTSWAVIGGLTYNFLPFMVLPIYVSLEKIDPRLLDAARDLFSNPFRAFRKVVLPLSLPGIFAGSLLVFIPAAGDFVNAALLGSPQTAHDRQRRAGQLPRDPRLSVGGRDLVRADGDHHGARAVYSKLLGTEDLTV